MLPRLFIPVSSSESHLDNFNMIKISTINNNNVQDITQNQMFMLSLKGIKTRTYKTNRCSAAQIWPAAVHQLSRNSHIGHSHPYSVCA